ncbi:hypothetical protein [Mycobacterium sp.]|uniref:hypothetical protein n=1 Tax=Mycobacterium sp. TaxID=1785 RepID=UPI0031E33EB5
MEDELLYFSVPVEYIKGYTIWNEYMNYYGKTQGMRLKYIINDIFNIDLDNKVDTEKYTVVKKSLINNTEYLITSKTFIKYFIVLEKNSMPDIVTKKGDQKYYTNQCARCGKVETSFSPHEQIPYMGGRIYLCHSCRNKVEKRVKSEQSSRKNIKRTNLEIMIKEILDSLGVNYYEEYAIDLGIFTKIVDFYIPCANLIIEGNGYSFHSNLNKEKLGTKHGEEAYFVAVLKDIISYFQMQNFGYNIYILTDLELNKNTTLETKNIIKEDLSKVLMLNGCKDNINIFFTENGVVKTKNYNPYYSDNIHFR